MCLLLYMIAKPIRPSTPNAAPTPTPILAPPDRVAAAAGMKLGEGVMDGVGDVVAVREGAGVPDAVGDDDASCAHQIWDDGGA